MDEASQSKTVDFKGIGEGLHVTRCGSSSSRGSSIDLSGDEQEWFRHGSFGQEILSYVPGSKSPDSSERGAQTYPLQTELSTATQLHGPVSEPYPHVPLYRYYCDIQRHEEVALGVTSDHRLKKQRYELCNSQLTASTLLVDPWAEDVGHSASSGSSSVLSSPEGSSAGLDDSAADTLGELNRIYSSSEWQSMSQDEQAICLHRMQKLKRRIRNEENPRRLNSARLRKRTKTNHTSK